MLRLEFMVSTNCRSINVVLFLARFCLAFSVSFIHVLIQR